MSDGADLKTLTDWFTRTFSWLQSVCEIPPHAKLIDEGSVFSLYKPTWLNFWVRKFVTADNGKAHVNKIVRTFEEIDVQVKQLRVNDHKIPMLYLTHLLTLLERSKSGLNNLAQNQDYASQALITSPLKYVTAFKIPLIVLELEQHIQDRQHP